MIDKLEEAFDAIIIGGGFYGISVSNYLKKKRGFKNILILEQLNTILEKASKNNQGRIHQGYHYPRSQMTASSSKLNYKKFLDDWQNFIDTKQINLYGVAKN